MTLTPEEIAAFRPAAASLIASTEEMEFAGAQGKISDSMRAAHFQTSAAVVRPIVSCYRRTGIFPVLRYRGWLFRCGPSDLSGENIALTLIREASIETVEE
jgi:hypothetical protein